MHQLPTLLLQGPGSAELVIILLVLLAFVGIFAVWVGISYWVYTDAEKRGNDNPALWAIIVFFVGIPGVIVWFLVRDDL